MRQADGTISWKLSSCALDGTDSDGSSGGGVGAAAAHACSARFAIPGAALPPACAGLLAAYQWRLACEVGSGASPQLSVSLQVRGGGRGDMKGGLPPDLLLCSQCRPPSLATVGGRRGPCRDRRRLVVQ